MITWLGGADCVPSAWRSSDSTITMRVNPVIINKMAGRNDSAVKNNSVWIGTEKLVPLLPEPTSTGRLPPDCAQADTCQVHSTSAVRTRMACHPSRRMVRLRWRRNARLLLQGAGKVRRGHRRGRCREHMQALDVLRRHAQHQQRAGVLGPDLH